MLDRSTRLRFRRVVRRQKKQAQLLSDETEKQLERLVARRINNLSGVRRFVAGWSLLVTLLVGLGIYQIVTLPGYYQKVRPIPGGIYTEGIQGAFTNANPLYAVSPVDASVSHLIFSGLLTYDADNRLTGDLAEKWTFDETGKQLTVQLRSGLFWHDGKPLTAADVVFTYNAIQHPDARSPLAQSFKDVTVQAADARTVTFTLPSSLSSFPNSLTNGIVPKHLLSGIKPSELRSAQFNTVRPVGSGPFQWSSVTVTGETVESREERVTLSAFKRYHQGAPKLESFVIRTFRTAASLKKAMEKNELSAAVGIQALDPDLKAKSYSFPLTAQTNIFLKTTHPKLGDKRVRQALAYATDRAAIIGALGYPAQAVRSPFLRGQIGYSAAYLLPNNDTKEADRLLDEAGWQKNSTGVRTNKDKATLDIDLVFQDDPDQRVVVDEIERQWRNIGVGVKKIPLDATTIDTELISSHDYMMLLKGITVGADPDVFVYWHSSQYDPRLKVRLNLSEFNNKVADSSLETGRTRLDPAVRAVKYRPFLEQWKENVPAITLYQPRFLYVARSTVYNLQEQTLNTATDRYRNVHNWMVAEEKR